MPAIITHDYFGHALYDQLRRTIGNTRDERHAFLLGNQGPDPLFYTVIDPRYLPMRKLYTIGSKMHGGNPSSLLLAFRYSLLHLSPADYRIGRAYVLGFMCHYALDSTMHPFIYAQQYALCDAGVPGLSRRDGHEVHAVIESELDELVLFTKLNQTISTFNPAYHILQADDTVLNIISKIYAQVARMVYNISLPITYYADAVKEYRWTERRLYSPSGTKRAILGKIERTVRRHSFCQAASNRNIQLTKSTFDNNQHNAWINPFTGEEHTTSFWDINKLALEIAQEGMLAIDSDNFDASTAQKLTRNLNFSGIPT